MKKIAVAVVMMLITGILWSLARHQLHIPNDLTWFESLSGMICVYVGWLFFDVGWEYAFGEENDSKQKG